MATTYDANAEAYQRLWAPVLHPLGRELLRALPVERARRVLDLGTGVGALLPAIRESTPQAVVVGVDLSEGMLARAPQGFPLAAMDGARLAFRDGAFDAVAMAFMLFLFSEPEEPLGEVRRVLAPGGALGLAVWGEEPEYPAERVWDRTLDAHGAEQSEGLAHGLTDTPDKVAGLLDRAGFRAVRTWSRRLDHRMDLEWFLAYRRSMGSGKQRLATLPPGARGPCLTEVRRKLKELGPEDFVDRSEVIFAVARAPGEVR